MNLNVSTQNWFILRFNGELIVVICGNLCQFLGRSMEGDSESTSLHTKNRWLPVWYQTKNHIDMMFIIVRIFFFGSPVHIRREIFVIISVVYNHTTVLFPIFPRHRPWRILKISIALNLHAMNLTKFYEDRELYTNLLHLIVYQCVQCCCCLYTTSRFSGGRSEMQYRLKPVFPSLFGP